MQLELPVRWSETDKKAMREEELINGEDAVEIIKHSYGKLLIDSADIGPYYDIDATHTMVNDKFGKLYCIVVPVDQFKRIMTEITGKAIMSIQAREDIPSKPNRKRPRTKDDDDNILGD